MSEEQVYKALQKNQTLDEYLNTHKSKINDENFVPIARYNKDGDHIEVYIENKRCYLDNNLGGNVGIFRDNDAHNIVGVKIFDVESVIEVIKPLITETHSQKYDRVFFKKFNEGETAYNQNLDRQSNPYIKDTLSNEAWDAGWLAGWADKHYDNY
ncbi:hypothetical protein LCGC14_1498690 [marine sediment metagenome]|uniref:Uncharacterized protein n=1 Tax=marine sediment metagenome TaxID=412755 RepID=A0A0F9J562_9ZZZZ